MVGHAVACSGTLLVVEVIASVITETGKPGDFDI